MSVYEGGCTINEEERGVLVVQISQRAVEDAVEKAAREAARVTRRGMTFDGAIVQAAGFGETGAYVVTLLLSKMQPAEEV